MRMHAPNIRDRIVSLIQACEDLKQTTLDMLLAGHGLLGRMH